MDNNNILDKKNTANSLIECTSNWDGEPNDKKRVIWLDKNYIVKLLKDILTVSIILLFFLFTIFNTISHLYNLDDLKNHYLTSKNFAMQICWFISVIIAVSLAIIEHFYQNFHFKSKKLGCLICNLFLLLIFLAEPIHTGASFLSIILRLIACLLIFWSIHMICKNLCL